MSTPASLYLDFQIDDTPATQAKSVLSAAIEAAPVASVLLRPGRGAKIDSETVRPLIALAQAQGIAVLIASETGETNMLGADGIHLIWSQDIVRSFKTARQSTSDAIVGADAGRSRHDAMELGESGADYVAFGIPPHVEDREKAAQRQRDLIAWWSELFEVPCVAFDVPDSISAHALAVVGADFVSVSVTSSDTAKDAADRVRAFSEALRIPETAT
ncbi:thiamine phosphate synthase [Hyphomicrobium sp. B1]|uniref:thiamine phosphate synthase n=1 Tax=Hyphomicrobium sp. B1 TaxID=3075651 RepID=UPI003C2F2D31